MPIQSYQVFWPENCLLKHPGRATIHRHATRIDNGGKAPKLSAADSTKSADVGSSGQVVLAHSHFS